MAKKFGLEFEGFDEMLNRLERLDGDVKPTTEKALKATHAHITPTLHRAMTKHKRTGDTEKSIVEQAKVKWSGGVASVEVGFDISNGGLPSIFLMYGTPKMKKDQNLYNAIFSKKTREEVKAIQEEIFWNEVRRLEG